MNFVDNFRDLTTGQKFGAAGAIFIGLFLLIYLVVTMFTGTPETIEEEGQTTPPVSTVEESPSAVPTEPSSTESARPYVDGEEIPEVGENQLAVPEAREALDAAEKAVATFGQWDEGQDQADRQKAIDGLFVADSTSRLQLPNFNGASKEYVDSETGKNTFASHINIESVHPVGGDDKLFRVFVGAELRYQYVTPEGEAYTPIEVESIMYTVDMTNEGAGWKVIDIVRD